jgi:peroxiredoxin
MAPNIVLPDQTGRKITLDKINADKTLIVFYASWCPHCKELMPQIAELYNNQKTKNTEVLAVSMDSTLTDWKSYLNENNFNWLNVCDTAGWHSKAADDYYIYATPSMFLVDREMKIIDKPRSVEDLRKYYQN